MTRAQINRKIKPLGLGVIKNRLGRSYAYFIDLAEGGQVGESVLVYSLAQLTLDQWGDAAQGAWAEREAERLDLPLAQVHQAIKDMKTPEAVRAFFEIVQTRKA